MALLDFDPTCGSSLVYRGGEVLVSGDGALASVCCPQPTDGFKDTLSGYTAVEVPAEYSAPDGYRFITLREFFAYSSEEEVALAGRMKGYLNWLRSVRFCPSCGTRLSRGRVENSQVCPSCGNVHYPRISPCVIAVIERDGKMLLLKHKQRNRDIYACLAGFVEAGESLEHALRREVREETGLEICNIRYAGSQSWPFPDQLMVGFYADYLSGELKIQEDEISDARWFSPENIPASPRPGSISWKLIHHCI